MFILRLCTNLNEGISPLDQATPMANKRRARNPHCPLWGNGHFGVSLELPCPGKLPDFVVINPQFRGPA